MNLCKKMILLCLFKKWSTNFSQWVHPILTFSDLPQICAQCNPLNSRFPVEVCIQVFVCDLVSLSQIDSSYELSFLRIWVVVLIYPLFFTSLLFIKWLPYFAICGPLFVPYFWCHLYSWPLPPWCKFYHIIIWSPHLLW